MPDDVGVLALLSPIGFGYMTEEIEVTTPASWEDLPNYLPGVGIYAASNSACAQHIMMMAEICKFARDAGVDLWRSESDL